MTTLLDLAPDELLSTTRAVRRRLDLTRPVPLDVAVTDVAAVRLIAFTMLVVSEVVPERASRLDPDQ